MLIRKKKKEQIKSYNLHINLEINKNERIDFVFFFQLFHCV